MKISKEVQELIDKVAAGRLDQFKDHIEGSDFGIFIPTFVDGDEVKLMEDGKSQTESNLRITITDDPNDIPDDAEIVAWMGDPAGKDSTCSHGGTGSCSHCTTHEGACRHCTGHSRLAGLEELDAPELIYPTAVQDLEKRRGILEPLASEGFGLSLLHGHNSKSKFTQLPVGVVSVISDGITHFRSENEVMDDPTFVPSTWRFVDGMLHVAGGFSEQ